MAGAVRIQRRGDHLAAACLADRGVLLVRGPHGVGRTSLVAAAVASAWVSTGRRIVATTGPRLLADLCAVVDLAPSDRPTPADAARIVAAFGTGDEVCDALAVDDVHLADERAAQLLHHLVTNVGLPVLVTAPDGAPLPEPVEALRIADELSVVALPPFDVDEIHRLADAVLGGQLSSPAARRLHAESGGLPAEALDVLSRWRRSGALGDRHGVWWLAGAPLRADERTELVRAGEQRLSAGDAAAALAPLREAATAPPDGDEDAAVGSRAVVLLAAAELLTATADRSSSRSLVAGPPPPALLPGDRRLAAALVAAASHPRDEAATLADGTTSALLAEGDRARARAAARLAWALAPAERRRDTVIALADDDGDRIADLARADAEGDADAADALVDVLEAEGRLLDAVWAADVATGLWLTHGSARKAAAAAARADHLVSQCRLLRVVHRRPDAPRVELTARETEIAELVAEGWTNREIASRAHLSVRTVEGHVLRICGKLGVRDRAGIAPAMRPHQPRR